MSLDDMLTSEVPSPHLETMITAIGSSADAQPGSLRDLLQEYYTHPDHIREALIDPIMDNINGYREAQVGRIRRIALTVLECASAALAITGAIGIAYALARDEPHRLPAFISGTISSTAGVFYYYHAGRQPAPASCATDRLSKEDVIDVLNTYEPEIKKTLGMDSPKGLPTKGPSALTDAIERMITYYRSPKGKRHEDRCEGRVSAEYYLHGYYLTPDAIKRTYPHDDCARHVDRKSFFLTSIAIDLSIYLRREVGIPEEKRGGVMIDTAMLQRTLDDNAPRITAALRRGRA